MLGAVREAGVGTFAISSGAAIDTAGVSLPFDEAMRRTGLRESGSGSLMTGGATDARAAAEELVALTLVQPVLASLRSATMASAPFAPGLAEQRFGPLLDAAIARKVVKASGFGLVEALARKLRAPGAEARADAEQTGRTVNTNA